jgi:hypothetical protein
MLFLTTPTINRSAPLFRTCLSHPATSPDPFLPIDDNTISPLKFTSLPELTFPPAKRLRPQSLSVDPPTSSPITFIDSSELADKLKENFQLSIFDCGSPFRHSENRIHNSVLLRVSDKISRKRLKTNPTQHLNIDLKQLNECDFIILYDDNDNDRPPSSIEKEKQLSAGLKCASEEIQRCLSTKYPPIFILKNSFNHFLDLYPNFCESLQSHSSPSSPVCHPNNSL